MKLIRSIRGKFILLVVGIAILPAFTTALLFFFNEALRQSNARFAPIIFIMDMTGKNVESYDFSSFNSASLPKDGDLIISRNNEIMFSSIPGLKKGDRMPENLTGFINRYGNERMLLTDFSEKDGVSVGIFLFFPDNVFENLFHKRMNIGTVSGIAMIFFLLVMILLILRSITKSLKTFEHATRRVAEGELDFRLEMPGNDEFSSLSHSFELMRQKLKKEKEVRARTMMGVSHDLKTPLSSIKGYVEALQDGMASSEDQRQAYLRIIRAKTDILQDRIGDLIAYVKMETGEWKTSFKSVSALEFLSTLVIEFKDESRILPRNFSSKLDISGKAYILADRKLLKRAFENIFDNAVKFTAQNDSIFFSAAEHENCIAARIADSGLGIEKRHIPHLFEPFYRAENSRNSQGVGLGLASVKSIIENHGGSVSVESEPAQGTAFIITIPIDHTEKQPGP